MLIVLDLILMQTSESNCKVAAIGCGHNKNNRERDIEPPLRGATDTNCKQIPE